MNDRSNLEVCRAKCKLICNTAYVDLDVLKDTLIDHGLDPEATAEPNSSAIMLCAILVVKGWVETSRSEGGVSTSINYEAVKKNIIFWGRRYGLDTDGLLDGLSTIESGSHLW